jgi:hypothetical protein
MADLGRPRDRQTLCEGAVLRGRALAVDTTLLVTIRRYGASAVPTQVTPGGFEMSVAMTNCGHARRSHRPHGLLLRPARSKAACRGRRCQRVRELGA